MEKLLKPKELSETLGLGLSTVYKHLVTGEIPSVMVLKGRHKRSMRVRPSDLEKWLKKREVSQAMG